ncbi:MAG: methylmalonyl Co-A mutase-associated GTPase MeaB [Dermatophilaceae bacterium]
MGSRPIDVAPLVAGARRGEPRAVGRLVSLVESGHPALPEVMAALAPHTGRAHVVGITGAPGVGKSTTVGALIGAYRRRGYRVGVLAVDPTSPFTGGALLGDRIRMTEHAADPGVIIRSMATRGRLGGLSWATPQAVRVLDAAGCDVVLVETVGVGQSEVDVAATADTTVVLLAPGRGDGVQAAKAGILEIGDVLVVNKADVGGADRTVRELRNAIGLAAHDPADHGLAAHDPASRGAGSWRTPVLRAVASRGEGVDELAHAIDEHRERLGENGIRERRERRARSEIESVAVAAMRARLTAADDGRLLDALGTEVAAGRLDPYAAAEALLRPAPG